MANVAGYNRKLAALIRKHGLLEDVTLQPLIDKDRAAKTNNVPENQTQQK